MATQEIYETRFLTFAHFIPYISNWLIYLVIALPILFATYRTTSIFCLRLLLFCFVSTPSLNRHRYKIVTINKIRQFYMSVFNFSQFQSDFRRMHIAFIRFQIYKFAQWRVNNKRFQYWLTSVTTNKCIFVTLKIPKKTTLTFCGRREFPVITNRHVSFCFDQLKSTW